MGRAGKTGVHIVLAFMAWLIGESLANGGFAASGLSQAALFALLGGLILNLIAR